VWAASFPLKTNTPQKCRSERAAVNTASDHTDVDMFGQVLQFSPPVMCCTLYNRERFTYYIRC